MTEHQTASLSLQEKRALLGQLLRQKAEGTTLTACPLSYNQYPIWFLQQLEPASQPLISLLPCASDLR